MSLINTLMGVGEIEITDIGFKGQAHFHFLPSSAMAASGGPKKPSLAATTSIPYSFSHTLRYIEKMDESDLKTECTLQGASRPLLTVKLPVCLSFLSLSLK
jgi:hypothetical protein